MMTAKDKKGLKPHEMGLLAGAALILIGGLFWLNSLLSTYENIIDRLPDHSAETREYSAEKIQNPVRDQLRSDNKKTAIYQEARDKKAEIENEFIKDKRGLNAQEGTWYAATELLRFTAYQLFFLVITTIASFAGLYFIIQTLKATQSANAIVRDASRLELQPWLAVESLEISYKGMSDGNKGLMAMFEVTIPITNDGKTPITRVFIIVSQAVIEIDHPEYGNAAFRGHNCMGAGHFSPINAGKRAITAFPIALRKSDYGLRSVSSQGCWYSLSFDLCFKDSFTSDDRHRYLPIIANRTTNEEPGEVITSVHVGNELERLDSLKV